MNRLEALLDGIGSFNGAFDDPESAAYQLKNPLLLKSFGPPGKHETDSEGRRKFESLVAGYRAGLYDLQIKCGGSSRAKLKSNDTVASLFRVYGIFEPTSFKKILSFVRRSLHDETVNDKTELSYFYKPENNKITSQE